MLAFAEKNEFFWSGNRPENPQIFRLPQFFFLRIDKLQFVNAMNARLQQPRIFCIIRLQSRGCGHGR